MIAPLLATLAVLQGPAEQPPRLRTLLPNRAVVLVDRLPAAKTISVQLFASSRLTPETPATHGLRHLLEHLVAKGKGKDLDRRLESDGMFLRAYTYRDAMRFEVSAAPGQLDKALAALGEVMRPLEVTQEEIDREMPILASELALQDDVSRLGIAAWKQAYGDTGLDPLGTLEVMAKATPDALKLLERKQFYPENLVLVIAGPVELDDATKKASALVGARQGAVKGPDDTRPAGQPGRIESEAFGESRGALVPPFNETKTAAALAAALAIGTEFERSFVTYTPSSKNGLIVVGQTAATGGLGLRIDAVEDADLGRLYLLGKAMARAWVDRQMATPSGVGYLRGLLLVQGSSYRPETLTENIDAMTFEQFKEGFDLLRKERAVVSVGGR